MTQLGGKLLVSNAVWVKVTPCKDGCFEELRMARQGEKFDKELMKTGIILIQSLGLLGQMGEGQISAS